MKSTETKKKRNTQYLKFGKLELSLGNDKIGDDTIIFNMGSATYCPSRARGFCKLGDACYAYRAENMYPATGPYRDRQEFYWKRNTAFDIGNDIINALKSRRGKVDGKLVPMIDKIKYFRFNESGDFWSQASVKKLDIIASMLAYYNIKTYGYTARKDLDFSNVCFNVKGSSHNKGNNGITIARPQKVIDDCPIPGAYREEILGANRYFTICPGLCADCDFCKENNGMNIVFPLH